MTTDGQTNQAYPQALSIERVQGIAVSAGGTPTHWHQLYLRIFEEFITSGLAARLGGNATLVLIALGLHAGVLGDPQRPNAEAEFALLREWGVVSERDRGQLFTFVSAETIAEELSLNRETVRLNTKRLIEEGIVEKRSTTQLRLSNGRFGTDVYIIRPQSHIGRFAASQPDDRDGNSGTVLSRDGNSSTVSSRDGKPGTAEHRAGKPSTDFSGENEQPCRDFRTVPGFPATEKSGTNNSNKKEEKEKDNSAFDIIQSLFAHAVGLDAYTLSAKEHRQIEALWREDFSLEDIQAGIARAVQEARTRGQRINFSYCVPVIRRLRREREEPSKGESVVEQGSPSSVVETGNPLSKSGQPVVNPRVSDAPSLDELANGNAELRDLLELIQERNPHRVLGKSDVRAWLAVAEKYRSLAHQRGISPIALLKQAVLHGIGAQSDRAGYFTTTLAEAILDDWQPGTSKPHPHRNGNAGVPGQSNAAVQTPRRSKYPDDNERFAGGT